MFTIIENYKKIGLLFVMNNFAWSEELWQVEPVIDKNDNWSTTDEMIDKAYENWVSVEELQAIKDNFDKEKSELKADVREQIRITTISTSYWVLNSLTWKVNSVSPDKKQDIIRQIKKVNQVMIKLAWDRPDVNNLLSDTVTNENEKRELENVSYNWKEYKVWESYTLEWLRQFWLHGKNVVLNKIETYTDESWKEWMMWFSDDGDKYNLSFFWDLREKWKNNEEMDLLSVSYNWKEYKVWERYNKTTVEGFWMERINKVTEVTLISINEYTKSNWSIWYQWVSDDGNLSELSNYDIINKADKIIKKNINASVDKGIKVEPVKNKVEKNKKSDKSIETANETKSSAKEITTKEDATKKVEKNETISNTDKLSIKWNKKEFTEDWIRLIQEKLGFTEWNGLDGDFAPNTLVEVKKIASDGKIGLNALTKLGLVDKDKNAIWGLTEDMFNKGKLEKGNSNKIKFKELEKPEGIAEKLTEKFEEMKKWISELFISNEELKSFIWKNGEKIWIEYNKDTNSIELDTPFFDGISDYWLKDIPKEINTKEEALDYVTKKVKSIKAEYDKKYYEVEKENKKRHKETLDMLNGKY